MKNSVACFAKLLIVNMTRKRSMNNTVACFALLMVANIAANGLYNLTGNKNDDEKR